ncbi:MAG: hypothetical protein M3Q08_18420 [Pseudomonadota bacterium]|nr:hypothetical protein [Pseudomonadota bacterium]
MSRAAVRQLIKTTLETSVTRLQSAGTADDPSRVAAHPVWDWEGLSPAAAVHHEASDTVEEARALYSNLYDFSLWLYVLADRNAPGVPPNIEALAETIMDELFAQAVPALRQAGFEVLKSDGTPNNAPWRKFNGIRYRAERIPLRYEVANGDV